MNIGLDLRNIGKKRTGDETVFFHLAKHLPQVGRGDTFQFLLDNRTESEMKHIKKRLHGDGSWSQNVTFHQLGNGNKFLWNALLAPYSARSLHLDIYHTQYIIPFFMPKKTKIVTHIHDISFMKFPEYISLKDRFFLNTLIPRSLKQSSAIIAVSEFTKQEIVSSYGIKPEKIFVVSNASDVLPMKKSLCANERIRVQKKYNLPESFLFHIGTLQPRKNIPFLLEGFFRLRERNPDISLLCTGTKNSYHYDNRIDDVIAKYHLEKNVRFLGYVEEKDLSSIMDLSRAVVSVSLYEGFGLPLLEAMNRGVCLVVSDIPAYREVANDAPVYVHLGDVKELTESLYRVIMDKPFADALREKGLSRSVFFSWEQSAKTLVDVYHAIAEKNNV